MTQNLKKISGSAVSFRFSVDAGDIEKAKKKVLQKLRAEVRVKGFRQGTAPDDMIIEYVGMERITFEAMNRAVEEKYLSFLNENKIRPVNTPHLKVADEAKIPLEVSGEVEIFPEVEIGNYQKIKLSPVKIEVTEKEVTDVMVSIMREMGLTKTVDRPAQKGDTVNINFEGKDDKGTPVEHTKGENIPFVVGSGHFLEDLEKACIGMKAGEEKKKVKVSFPKTYHSTEIAGKSLFFDIKINSVAEVSVEHLDEEALERITGQKKKKEEFKEEVHGIVKRNKEAQAKKKQIEEYQERLLKLVRADMPVSWITREADMRMEEIKHSPRFKHDPESFWKTLNKKEEDLLKEFRKEAEKNLLVFLALSEIVRKENIELDKDEIKQAEMRAKERGGEYEQEFQSAVLHLKIDKYLEGVTLTKET